jgi:FAD/FMN-containing dehydrogenase
VIARAARTARLAGWGRYPVAECRLLEPDSVEEIVESLCTNGTRAIARGNGRSYGDSSLSPECTVSMRRFDRLLAFDGTTGTLTCEGGAILADVIDTLAPRGWFPPVTPGTKFVTVGGMIASDVHGKNHHLAGSFSDHVLSFDLATGDGEVLHCSRSDNRDVFAATCGGMGLTGVILRATFRLIPIATSRVVQTTIRAPDLASAMALFEEYREAPYSVAWIDCFASGAKLGRSVVIVGEHAALERLEASERAQPYARKPRSARRFPFDLPGFALNRVSVSAFNALYYRLQRPGRSIVDLETYFYPLDAVHDWNRLYGRRGFVQYQCALPLEASRDGLRKLLTEIARAGEGSFLGVLKKLGPKSFGYLSFPLDGYTLALDFPARPATFELLGRLDDIVAAHGGRIYLTKDARAPAHVIASGYPEIDAFRAVRRRYGLEKRFASLQSRRLEL